MKDNQITMDDWCKKVCANYRENCMSCRCVKSYWKWSTSGQSLEDLPLLNKKEAL